MEHGLLINILLMLVIAIVAIAIFRRLGLPAILAYLVAGFLSGPTGFNWFSQNQIHSVAELGVVLLMFTLGLEFSLPKLWAMRKTVFGLGSGQVIITAFVTTAISMLFGYPLSQSLVIGAVIALSSTAIVLQLLNQKGWLRRRHGELSVSVLLFQDLAVVPLLILLPFLSPDGQSLHYQEVAYGLAKGILAFLFLMALGKWGLPKIFDEVAHSRSNELFVLTTLVVALLTGAFTQWLGLSMALGAFMAGMLLSESQYRRQLEADIRPFRDLLMGLFFISIGMLLDASLVLQFWWQIIVLLVAVVLAKGLVLYILLRINKESAKNAAISAMTLAQVGEFSFVVIALANNYSLLDNHTSTILVMVAVLSMAITPWLVRHSIDLAKLFHNKHKDEPASLLTSKQELSDYVLILGYGRVGQTIARFLKTEAIPYLVLDLDPVRVNESRNAGEPVYFGDARKRIILNQLGVAQAQMVVVTFGEFHAAEEVVNLCRAIAPNITILVRTKDDNSLDLLENAGASQVIPESLEGSLMMVSQVLYQCGVPLTRILKRLEQERRDHYRYLHGFFSGDGSELPLELLHAVALPENASAVGKVLSDIPWDKLKVELKAIRRNGQEVDSPSSSWLIMSGDILLLQGKPRRVERAESYLLKH